MKTITFLLTAGILCLTSCNKSKDPDIQTLRSVAADKSQPDYIRKSVRIFDDFFQEEAFSRNDYERARAELSATRSETTLKSLIAILHSLEKRLPEQLPEEHQTMVFFKNLGDDKNVKYKINPFLVLAFTKHIIPVITYYDVQEADSEVIGFFTRFETKYGSSSAGKFWLEEFRMEWKQAMEGREGNHGKWYSGREKMGLDRPWDE